MGADVESLTKRPLVFEPGLNIMDAHMAMGALESVAPRKSCQWKRCMMVLYYNWFIYSASQFLHPVPSIWPTTPWLSSRLNRSVMFPTQCQIRIFVYSRVHPYSFRPNSNATRIKARRYEAFIQLIYSIPSIRGFLIPLFLFHVSSSTLTIARWLGLTASQSTPTCSQYR